MPHFYLIDMKIKSFFSLSLLLVFGLVTQAQTKKWTLEECVRYALQNNISIKQTALDSESAAIDKKGAVGNFLPSVNANASHSWNVGLNQNITTGLLQNQTTQYTSAGASVGVDIYKGRDDNYNDRMEEFTGKTGYFSPTDDSAFRGKLKFIGRTYLKILSDIK